LGKGYRRRLLELMGIKYYQDSEDLYELREPPAIYHYRIQALFDFIQGQQCVSVAVNNLLLQLLIEAGVCNRPIHPKNLSAFRLAVMSLLKLPELPDLSHLTELLDDMPPDDVYQTSGNPEARQLTNLASIYDPVTALKYWETLPLSTIESIIWESRQSILINAVKDKLTPESINHRKAEKALKAKLANTEEAVRWVQDQIQGLKTSDKAKEALSDIKL
jgi:hypothetical protein